MLTRSPCFPGTYIFEYSHAIFEGRENVQNEERTRRIAADLSVSLDPARYGETRAEVSVEMSQLGVVMPNYGAVYTLVILRT